jgi:hypothetical protein
MENERQARGGTFGEMHKRRITLDDGRYLIFYTFGGDEPSPAPQSAEEQSAASKPEPLAESLAEEERSV